MTIPRQNFWHRYPGAIQVAWSLLAMLLLAAFLGLIKFFQISIAMSQQAAMQPPAAAVTTQRVEFSAWQEEIYSTASLSAKKGTMLSIEEGGVVAQIAFESGSSVAEGDLLIALDTSVEEADLKGAKAELERAKLAAQRGRRLREANSVSIEELERLEADLRKAEAQALSIEARINRKRVRAPFAGLTGIRMVNLGEYIAPGTAIVPLQSLENLYIDFSVPQSQFHLVQKGQSLELQVDAFSQKTFPAIVTSINPEIDAATRTVMVQAELNNTDQQLRPGMFGRVRLLLPKHSDYLTIPASSVSFAPFGNSVYLIDIMRDPSGKEYAGARQQIIKIGPRRGDQIAVLEGLAEGQEIVTSGAFKLRPGEAVQVNNSVAPSNLSNPKPSDT